MRRLNAGLAAALVMAAGGLPRSVQARPDYPRGETASARAGHRSSSTSRTTWVPVLIYHHVKVLQPADDAIERGLTVLPPQFEAEVSYLAANRYHPVSAARLVSYLLGGQPLPKRPVVLTFDDGYTDIYRTAYRTLLRHHMTATFFIVPGFLGKARYLTWRQVEDMARHGMDIEAHSMTHPDLTTLSGAQIHAELTISRDQLTRHLHHPVGVFAYPYGAYNRSVKYEVVKAGYLAAFTTHQSGWERASRLLTLPRLYVNINDDLARFAGILTPHGRRS